MYREDRLSEANGRSRKYSQEAAAVQESDQDDLNWSGGPAGRDAAPIPELSEDEAKGLLMD